jgi:hypothetical protein
LQVIKIEPSTCSLTEFVYVDANGKVRLRERAPEKLMQDVRFDAGKAYYLGDFYVEPSTAGANKKTSNVWEIKTIRNGFSNTSAVLKSVYPNLAKLPTENRMIGR